MKSQRVSKCVISIIIGFWMIFDGVYVLINDTYFGGDPGPWTEVVELINLDPFTLGPFFVFFGIVWVINAYLQFNNTKEYFIFELTISLLTMLYLIIGSIFAIMYFIILLLSKYMDPDE